MTERPSWDEHFMAKARLNAQMSTCLSRRVGAVAVHNRRELADGFNGNLPGAVHCNDGGCDRCANRALPGDDLLRCVCVHAEHNLVAWCSRRGISLEGATVFTTTHPCLDCFKLLVTAGVIEIVYDESYPEAEEMLPAFGFIPGLRIRKYSND